MKSSFIPVFVCVAAFAGPDPVGQDPRWKVAGRTISLIDEKGKRALKIGEGPEEGLVWLDGYEFANGVIEIDMLERSQPLQGSLLGVGSA